MYRRCPSAYRVSNASELFPEPDGPVMTMSARCGSSTVMPCRLFCRALTMRIIGGKHSGFGERSVRAEKAAERAERDCCCFLSAFSAFYDLCRAATFLANASFTHQQVPSPRISTHEYGVAGG